LKEEGQDRNLWRIDYGRGYGPVVQQTTEWMNEWKNEWMQSSWLQKGTILLDLVGMLILVASTWYKLPVSLQSLIRNGLVLCWLR
jgi:hypothetical protein